MRPAPSSTGWFETYAPFAARGVPIVGLEPSCLLTLRDELLALRKDETAKAISAHALLFEEFLVREARGRPAQAAARRRSAARCWCTAIATRSPLARSSRSSRRCG